jgi:hypothetical protein
MDFVEASTAEFDVKGTKEYGRRSDMLFGITT